MLNIQTKDDKHSPKQGLNDESRIITCKEYSSSGNILALNQRSTNKREIQCLSDTELHNKSGVMYPFLCHIVQYEKAAYQKKTKRATSRIHNKGVNLSGSVPFCAQKTVVLKLRAIKFVRNVWAGLCHNRYIRKMGILSSNSVSYFPQLLAEIERKGGIHEVFVIGTNFKASI